MTSTLLEVRRVEPDRDLPAVLGLFAEVFGREASPEVWRWKYLPPGTDRPYAWVGFAEGRLLGFVGAVPLRGVVEGTPTAFFQLGDVMVRPDQRARHDYLGAAPGRMFDAILRDHPAAVLYGFTGRRLARWYERAGLSSLLEEAADRIAVPGPGDPRVELRAWGWDDPEVDRLWATLGVAVRAGLVRDGRYLRWRYRDHPRYGYRLLGTYEAGEPIGWMVVADGPEAGPPPEEVRIQDLLLPWDRAPRVLRGAARCLGAEALVLWAPGRLWKEELKSRETGWVVMHHLHGSTVPADFLRSRFHYALGEADEWWW